MAEIKELLNTPDNVEVIRDQLGAILYEEMQNQYEIAMEQEDPVADDYLATVLVENDEPLNAGGDNDLFPIINIAIDSVVNAEKGTSSVNYRKKRVRFYIDCYQTGNYTGKFAGRTASLKAWKLARCVRNILDSDVYTYLLLRGIVSETAINEMRSGVPNMADAAMKVVVVRLIFEVTYDQTAPQTTGPGMEILPVVISDENGQVVVNIK